MKEQANNHQTILEELVPDLALEGLSLEVIQKTASETEQKVSEINKTYLRECVANLTTLKLIYGCVHIRKNPYLED